MQISSVSGNLTTGVNAGQSATGQSQGVSFADILSDALNNATQAQQADQQGTLALLSGQDNGIHTALIASQEAELSLDLLVQVRNKVIDAYNEIMHMQL